MKPGWKDVFWKKIAEPKRERQGEKEWAKRVRVMGKRREGEGVKKWRERQK